MRAVTVEEIEQISGGLKKIYSKNGLKPEDSWAPCNPTCPGTTVGGSGPPNTGYPPVSGGGAPVGGGSGPGGGGGSGGGSGSPITEQEIQNAIETAIQEAEAGTLETTIANSIFTSTDYAQMAAEMNSTQVQYGVDSYNQFEPYGNNSYETPYYGEFIHWDRVNWSSYDDGGTATPYQAMNNLFHDIDVNHHVSLTPTSTWSG